MQKIANILSFVCLILVVSGCSGDGTKSDKETYKVTGEIESVEKTGAVIEGVQSEYALKLIDIEKGTNSDSQEMFVSITKDTAILDNQKNNIEVTALKPGTRVKVTWRFANDHLTEAVEVSLD